MSSLPGPHARAIPTQTTDANARPAPRIFVSYAHRDDFKVPEAPCGWVTALVKHIDAVLPSLVNRTENIRPWLDHRALSPVESITDQILDAVRQASVLLVVLSPAYLDSDWCTRERKEFLSIVRDYGKSRVFVIEKLPVEEKPEEFRDLRGFTFYLADEDERTLTLGFPVAIPNDPKHARYYQNVQWLCECLAKALKQHSTKPLELKRGTQVIARPDSKAALTVFLSPVDYELEEKWESVQRYLDQAGVKTLPSSAHAYSLEPGTFSEAAEADLKGCDLFVQLLGMSPFWGPGDSPADYAQLLVKKAESLGKPVLQWRHPQIRLDRVADPTHRKLLDSDTVRAESLEDFKQEIRRRAFEPPPCADPTVFAYVLVDTTEEDAPLARQVSDALNKYGVSVMEYHFPETEGRSIGQKPRDRLDANLSKCKAFIVVYGESDPDWVWAQYREWRKIRGVQPSNALALIDGPPKKATSLLIPGMHVLDCRNGLDETKLKEFLDQTRLEAKP